VDGGMQLIPHLRPVIVEELVQVGSQGLVAVEEVVQSDIHPGRKQRTFIAELEWIVIPISLTFVAPQAP